MHRPLSGIPLYCRSLCQGCFLLMLGLGPSIISCAEAVQSALSSSGGIAFCVGVHQCVHGRNLLTVLTNKLKSIRNKLIIKP